MSSCCHPIPYLDSCAGSSFRSQNKLIVRYPQRLSVNDWGGVWESGRSRGWGACHVCNRGKRESVCSEAEPLQAAHISPGIYICWILLLHCLISHMHVFVPPFPDTLLLFFFLIALLPIFSSVLYLGFSPPASLSSLHLLPSLFWKQCNSPFQRQRSSLISCTWITSPDTEGLFPHLWCAPRTKKTSAQFSLLQTNPQHLKSGCISEGSAALCWCSGSIWVWASLRLWTWWRIWDTREQKMAESACSTDGTILGASPTRHPTQWTLQFPLKTKANRAPLTNTHTGVNVLLNFLQMWDLWVA